MRKLLNAWAQNIRLEKQEPFPNWYKSSREQNTAEADTPTIVVWDKEQLWTWTRICTWEDTPIACWLKPAKGFGSQKRKAMHS